MTVDHPRRTAQTSLIVTCLIALAAVSACVATSPASSPMPSGGSPAATPSASASAESEGGAGAAGGDVPDNAVFLTYRDDTLAFSIQYVEGWQVVPATAGVVIRDKDSSESLTIVATPWDVGAWVTSTDLPLLQGQNGFSLIAHDTVVVGGTSIEHVSYHLPAPPDPVTGKEVPSTVDRYYVPGPRGLAVIGLSTPDGVDNVDAFRQMVESFAWS